MGNPFGIALTRPTKPIVPTFTPTNNTPATNMPATNTPATNSPATNTPINSNPYKDKSPWTFRQEKPTTTNNNSTATWINSGLNLTRHNPDGSTYQTPMDGIAGELLNGTTTEKPVDTIKTPEQEEADRQAKAQAELDSMKLDTRGEAPDTTVKRYDLKDQGAITEEEQQYRDYINNGLKTGQFADVESAIARTSRENRIQDSRGQMQAEAMASKAGFQAGTPEYQRFLDQANAQGQELNLSRTNATNQLQRNVYQDALERARGIGETQYGRATAERGYQSGADAIEFGRQDARYGENEQDIRDYINTLPENLKGIAQTMLAKGQDPRSATWFNPDGSVKEVFRGQDPATQNYMAQVKEAMLRNPRNSGETKEAYDQRIAVEARSRMNKQDAVAFAPIESAVKTNDISTKVDSYLEESAKTGKGLDANTWKQMNANRPDLVKSIPIAESITGNGYAKTAQKGDVVEYNGKKYVVINPKHHPKRKSWGNSRVRDGILAIDELGNEVEIAMTGEYDPD